ncbi:hypothetical protein AM593_04381, partial [Mytilus galloprovincialis]
MMVVLKYISLNFDFLKFPQATSIKPLVLTTKAHVTLPTTRAPVTTTAILTTKVPMATTDSNFYTSHFGALCSLMFDVSQYFLLEAIFFTLTNWDLDEKEGRKIPEGRSNS